MTAPTPLDKLIPGKLYRTLQKIDFYNKQWALTGSVEIVHVPTVAVLMFIEEKRASDNGAICSFCFLWGEGQLIYTETMLHNAGILLNCLEGPL